MGKTPVGGLLKAVSGTYSVYIDQDDQPDSFTVRPDTSEFSAAEDRTGFDMAACQKKTSSSGSFGPNFWCPEVPQGNSFELASKTPLDSSVLQNSAGEKLKAGAKVILLPEEKRVYGETKFSAGFTIRANGILNEYEFPPERPEWRGSWEIVGFKIVGFTDDPERKNVDNMSEFPDGERKYAVIHAVISSVKPVDYEMTPNYIGCYCCGGGGGNKWSPVYETRDVPLNRLSTKIPALRWEPDGATPPEEEDECHPNRLFWFKSEHGWIELHEHGISMVFDF